MQHIDVSMTQQYMDVCRILSTDCRDIISIKKLLCINLRTTDQSNLYTKVFEDIPSDTLFLDWNKVGSTYKAMASSEFWIYILERLCVMDYSTKNKALDDTKPVMLKTFQDHMKKCALPVDLKTVVFTFILVNIARVEGAHIIDIFLSKQCVKNAGTRCMQLMATMADNRFTHEEYIETMKWVLHEYVNINDQILRSDIDFVLNNVQENRKAMVMRTIQVSSGRMRLRDRLANKSHTPDDPDMMSDGFESFQRMTNFSSSVSHNTQLKAYVIMSQVAVDKDTVLENVLPFSVRQILKDILVKNPCPATMTKFIDKVSFSKAPFEELKAFNKLCFRSITLSSKNTLMITNLMQLYIAIYQHPSIWQQCWTHVLPVMNAQLIRDVEIFKESYPVMDTENFVYSLKTLH